MNALKRLILAGAGCCVAGLFPLFASEREVIDLSASSWNITLDRDAAWQNETLYLPPVDIRTLPVNEPTGGWEMLEHPDKSGVNLPATVEEYLWGYNGQTYGVTGNYTGVSWFTTRVSVPSDWKGRRMVMKVEAVRFRAEIFVNRKLVGYDVVNSTPFDVDLSEALVPGEENEIAFRITDPNGNFNWKDSQRYTWGDYLTNPSHGFGGITGSVSLVASDKVYIEDVFVKNRRNPKEIDIAVDIQNGTGAEVSDRSLSVEIREHATGKPVYRKTLDKKTLISGLNQAVHRVTLPSAKLWSVDEPNLYDLYVRLGDDAYKQRFGFRWFEVRDVKGDKQFYLNGKRIVLRTSISWSFWPYNGIAPSGELAVRQVKVAKSLGLNMLNFHRTIGCKKVLDAADELGLLYFEEPGGNQYDADRFEDGSMQTRFYFGYRNEKLARMIRRDRNHPSLVIYNLHNERGADPQEEDYAQMRMGHRLDPTRIMTYNSCNGENPENEPDAHFKLHLLPYDTVFYDYGWYDRHHAGGPGCYHDNLYVGKDNYHRFSNHKDEIVYWGEDGAIGTPPRLELIRKELLESGKMHSWETEDYLKWYDAYDRFLTERGFRGAFPTVDSLTRAMGNVAYYYQGRVIENIRMSNTVDAYAINGWESMKLENHSGMVDNFRHPKGNVETLSYYNRPLYLAVKMNRKVLGVNDTTVVDVYIVNEEDLKGTCQLALTLKDGQGKTLGSFRKKVKVSGGNVFGECLMTGWKITPSVEGYLTVEAELHQGGKRVASGLDKLFAVRLDVSGITDKGMIADTTGTLSNFMHTMGFKLPEYRKGTPSGDYLLVGAFRPQQWGSGISDIMEWVYKGHTLIIVDNPEEWAEYLSDKEVLDYRGSKILGKSWYGGNFFNRKHPIFEGLPQDCVFNWEYQCFATYNRRRLGLRCETGDILVGCVSDHRKEVYSALTVIPAGRGKVILSTLDIPACIKDVKPYAEAVDLDGMNESMNTFNTSSENKANIVGQRLLLNMLKQVYE